MRVSFPALLTAAVCSALVTGADARQASAPKSRINIPFEQFTLPNGLRVILSPDRTTPTVAVNVWYHVGSKNEQPGRTGFAHLFEHVMFTGSGNIPYGLHDRYTNAVGGSNNGTTDNDRTLYYETVPSNYLETAIWLEADRMGFLLDSLDVAKLNAQRDIVKNERREGVDNQPYGRVDEIIAEAMYPKGHPYSWDVIGSMADLSAASEEDVKNFFRLYYAPNNAILTIVGDFNPGEARGWVTKYFGEIPRGKPISRPKVAPATHTAEKRLLYEDALAPLPRLYLRWPTVGQKSEDQYALNVLGPVLAGPRTARLTQALVYEKQAAATIGAFHNAVEDVGEFAITVTPRPNATLTALEADIDAIVERLKTEGPTAQEIQAALASQELQFLNGLQSNLGKSMQLADAAGYNGDPAYLKVEYEKQLAVTPADVKRVVNKYLTKGRIVLSVVPQGKSELASKPDQSQRIK